MDALMGQLFIRNVDDDIIEAYKSRARAAGLSFEQYMRDFLRQHLPTPSAERLQFTRGICDSTESPVEPLTKEESREGIE